MSGERSLISIVLPTYNGARYLAQSIRSCLDQTYSNLELIVVDDCSSDDTPSVIDGFARADERVRVIRNEKNQRLPRSLNIGFAEARGELFTWTSDDNLYRPDALQVMVDVLGRIGADLVYAHQAIIDDEGKEVGTFRVKEPVHLLEDNCINACFLYRRQVHEELGGYDPDRALIEDYDFWQRAMARFKLIAIDRDLYLYRRHSASLTATRTQEIWAMRMRMMDRNLPLLTNQPRAARAKAHLMVARQALELGQRGVARRNLVRGFRLSPVAAIRWGKRVAWKTIADFGG